MSSGKYERIPENPKEQFKKSSGSAFNKVGKVTDENLRKVCDTFRHGLDDLDDSIHEITFGNEHDEEVADDLVDGVKPPSKHGSSNDAIEAIREGIAYIGECFNELSRQGQKHVIAPVCKFFGQIAAAVSNRATAGNTSEQEALGRTKHPRGYDSVSTDELSKGNSPVQYVEESDSEEEEDEGHSPNGRDHHNSPFQS